MFGGCPIKWIPLLAVLAAGCGGGQSSVSPTPVAPAASVFSLTCAIGTTTCATVMQGQTLNFTARPGDAGGVVRSAVLNFGDGTPAVDLGAFATAVTQTHRYQTLGRFTARLDVALANGETRAASTAIEVNTLVTASVGAENLGSLNVRATADVEGAAVVRYDWLFEPTGPLVSSTVPTVLFTYATPGYKAVELRALLADGRVVIATSAVIVGREHEP